MDIFKKMFINNKNSDNENSSKSASLLKDNFKKPIWFDENDTDDELFGNNIFGLHIFSIPKNIQEKLDHDMREMLDNIEMFEEQMNKSDQSQFDFQEDFKDEKTDHDLDDEMYTQQLNKLIQRLSPDLSSIVKDNSTISEKKSEIIKKSDKDIIMDYIHGTHIEPEQKSVPAKRVIVPKVPSNNKSFDNMFNGKKMFGQSIVTQTIRRPDGSYETRRIVRDSDGNSKTTITKSIDGKTETTTIDSKDTENEDFKKPVTNYNIFNDYKNLSILKLDKNMFITKDGYTLPKNIW